MCLAFHTEPLVISAQWASPPVASLHSGLLNIMNYFEKGSVLLHESKFKAMPQS